MPYITHERAVELTAQRDRSLLVGNGFSMAQGGGDFSYGNLLEKSELPADSPIRTVFQELGTVDFEEVMSALEHASLIESCYGDQAKSELFRTDAAELREGLIRAVHAVHPEIIFDIPGPQLQACARFLGLFEKIFTINYDLLLYWARLNSDKLKFADGFGLGEEINGFKEFHEDAYCHIYYLHGALHLFLGGEKQTLKRVRTRGTIVDDIYETIRIDGRLPLFVAEGSSSQKLGKINSVPYLRFCLDALQSLGGALFVFGHSASENDKHIYDAIESSNVSDVYFYVHDPERNLHAFEETFAAFKVRNPNVELNFVDAGTAAVWG